MARIVNSLISRCRAWVAVIEIPTPEGLDGASLERDLRDRHARRPVPSVRESGIPGEGVA